VKGETGAGGKPLRARGPAACGRAAGKRAKRGAGRGRNGKGIPDPKALGAPAGVPTGGQGNVWSEEWAWDRGPGQAPGEKQKAGNGGGNGRLQESSTGLPRETAGLLRGGFNSPRGKNFCGVRWTATNMRSLVNEPGFGSPFPTGQADGKDVRRDHHPQQSDALSAPQSFPIPWWLAPHPPPQRGNNSIS
jgi:hypothetical protein